MYVCMHVCAYVYQVVNTNEYAMDQNGFQAQVWEAYRDVFHAANLVGDQYPGAVKRLALYVSQLLHSYLPTCFCLTDNLHSWAAASAS